MAKTGPGLSRKLCRVLLLLLFVRFFLFGLRQLQEEGFVLAHWTHSLPRWGRYGGRSVQHRVCCQEAEMKTDE